MSLPSAPIKSYQGFKEGDYVSRKGRLCLVKKIHFEMHPPSVTVKMMDNDCEVGTEFDRLQHIKAWFCNMCTAQNNEASDTKCCFCGMNRDYKEKVIVDDQTQNDDHTIKPTQSSPPIDTESDDDSEQSEQSEQEQRDHTMDEPESSTESGHQHQVEPQYENESEDETDEEPEPAVYQPHRSPFPMYDRFPPRHHSQYKRPQRPQRQQRAQRPRQRSMPRTQFPTFWPSYSLFDW